MSAAAVATRANPYVGPRAFRTGEQLYGRDRELRRLLDLLIAERIVLLFAPSGAGKTSLVQAALIPRLIAEGFAVLPPIRVNQELPGQLAIATAPAAPADTGDELLSALIGQVNTPAPTSNGTTPRRNGSTHTALTGPNRYLLSAMLSLEEARPPEARIPVAELAGLSFDAYLQRREAEYPEADGLVLVFDQFEEILTLNTADRPAKEQFFAQVGAALLRPNRWALFSMREDFVGAMEPYLRFVPTQLSNTFRLDLLDVRAAREAMQLPVQAQDMLFTDAAATRLVDNLRLVRVLHPDGVVEEQLGPYVEPVQLQVVCYRLWAQLDPDDRSIDPEDVAALGDVDSALTDYYAERVTAIAATTGVDERAIRDWCEHSLITEQGIRGQVVLGAGGLPELAVRALVNAHLVRAEPRRGAIWCELAHDRLINPVREDNARWRAEHLSPLQSQATLWARQDRQQGLLLRGEALAEAERWAATSGATLTPDEQEFLEASRALRAAEERERRNARRIRLLALVSAVAAVAAVVLAFWAIWEQNNAAEQARIAREQATRAEQEAARADQQVRLAEVRALTTASRQSRTTSPQYAALLAVEAWRRAEMYGLADGSVTETLHQTLAVLAGQPLYGGAEPIRAASFAPDGTVLGVAADSAVWRWSLGAPKGELLGRPAVDEEAVTAAISADGSTVITFNMFSYLRLWRTDTLSAEPLSPRGPELNQPRLSPDGRWLAGSGTNGGLVLWDSWTPDQPSFPIADERLQGLYGLSHAFTPDGAGLLIAAREYGAARLDLATPDGPPTMLRSTISGYPSGFSPDGRRLLTFEEGMLRIYDLSDEAAPPRELRLPDTNLGAAAFSPDGGRLALINDVRIWLWDLQSGEEQLTRLFTDLSGDGAAFPSGALAFDPTGQQLAVAFSDRRTLVWNLAAQGSLPQALSGQDEPALELNFSSDGRALLGVGGTTRLWPVEVPWNHPNRLSGGVDDSTSQIHLTSEGELLGANFDGTLLRWRIAQPTSPPDRVPLPEGTYALAFSPSGRLAAAVESAGDFTLRSALDGTLISTLTPANESTSVQLAVAFGPDERLLATTDQNGRVRIWDIGAPEAPRELGGPRQRATFLAFSADGAYLAGAGDQTPIYIWRTADLTAAPVTLRPPGGTGGAKATALAISASARYLAIGGNDGAIWLWHEPLADEPATPRALRSYTVRILSLAFSADERSMASSGLRSDQTLRVWRLDDLTASASLITAQPLEGGPSSLRFAPDGSALYTNSIMGSVGAAMRWALDPAELAARTCAAAGRNMSWQEWEAIRGEADPIYAKTCPDLPISITVVAVARSRAEQGRADESRALFERAVELEPGLNLDLEFETREARWAETVDRGNAELLEGRYAEAAASFAEAGQLSERGIDFALLFDLCRQGALNGAAEVVLPACDDMMLYGDLVDARTHESRAIARALTDDIVGAAEDLEQALALEATVASPEDEVARRRAWLETLRGDQNPFTETVLAELRRE